jgi:hypothetical protein
MESKLDIASYVVRWYHRLMTPVEQRAQRHLWAAIKATRGRSDVEAQRETRKSIIFSRLLSDSADVLSLTGAGYDAFRDTTPLLNERRHAF